jgi:ribosome-binding protein aMBF1 (putative translation factor)
MNHIQLIHELIPHYGTITKLARALKNNATYVQGYLDGSITPTEDTIRKIEALAIDLGLIK